MAIISKTGNISHEGCVIDTMRKECRVMSDVYTDADYALLWNPEEQRAEWKRINVLYMGCDDHRQIVVDINKGEYAEDYEIYLFLQEEARKVADYRKAEREAKKACLTVRKGQQSRVGAGRKVAKGTEGVIFYTREQEWGIRIGFEDDNGKAHWTYLKNVVAAVDEPEEGWLQYAADKGLYLSEYTRKINPTPIPV